LALRRIRRRPRNDLPRILGHPLVSTGRRLGQFPLEVEEELEEVVAPLRRSAGPGDFQTGSDGVGALAAAEAVGPAQALHLQVRRFRVRPDMAGRAGTMSLANGMAAGDQCDGFL